MLTSETLTQERFTRRTERTARDMGWGSTDAALGIVNRYLQETKDIFSEAMTKARRTNTIPKDIWEAMEAIGPLKIALAGLQIGLSCVAAQAAMTNTLESLGLEIENEVFAYLLSTWDEKKAILLKRTVSRKHGNLSYRRTAAKSLARKQGYQRAPWARSQKIIVGKWVLESLLKGSVFVLDDQSSKSFLTITSEALEVAQDLVEHLTSVRPVLLPSKEPLPAWKASTTVIDGFRQKLVRKNDRETQAIISKAIKDGTMQPVLDAVNGIQDVAWRINTDILDLVEWAYSTGLKVGGLPPRDDLSIPKQSKPYEEMTENEQRLWRKSVGDIKELNRSYLGLRILMDQDLAAAHHLKDGPFYVPHNLDYRGRVYGMSFFNFQRLDYVRAMFLFDQGKPITEEGMYWLKVHVANTGDFGKVSKKSFDERVAWVENNVMDIVLTAKNPEKFLWWTEADCPFQFIAACKELVAAEEDPNFISHLPVSFDGSCSGLQHLCAMTRAPEGILVNLGSTEAPNDIYSVVAGKAEEKIRADLGNPKLGHVAKVCLDHGIGRSLVKRNVMTYSYSSKKFGMAGQHQEDTMKPLEYKVMAGEIERHPFEVPEDTIVTESGSTVHRPGQTASRYLASRVYAAIEDVVSLPAQAMTYLQGIARALAHESKPVLWHTPLGFPVLLKYPVFELEAVNMWLNDRGVKRRIQPALASETPKIDKSRAANAIAPGFVHSMDACHLMMVVNEAREQGITSVALVHDSFGCLPSDVGQFRRIINETFYKLYAEHDVLKDIREEALAQIETNAHRVPEVPEYGALDIRGVLEAPYAFA